MVTPNKLLRYIIILLLLIPGNVFSRGSTARAPVTQVPFSRGVNLSGWFDEVPKNAQEIHNRYSERDFINVKQMGFDTIRIPIDFYLFTSRAPAYTIDPFLFRMLDVAVDLAEKHQMYIILDFHPENQPVIDKSIESFLLPVWRQIAAHYKNRSEYVIYEILNEPWGISDEDWGRIQGEAIKAIRSIDQNHWIVVGGTNYNSIETLFLLPEYDDDKLLYTFHFYEPYLFTHQGVGSTNPSLENLAGVPFPFRKNRMPFIPRELRGTWVETSLSNRYYHDGNIKTVKKILQRADDFSKQRNVPVFCGEFGALKRNSLPRDRVQWHKLVREELGKYGIPWILWCYDDNFGIFNSQLDGAFTWVSIGDVYTDLNVELIRALGLNPFPQRRKQQIQSGFTIFDDDFGNGVRLHHRVVNTINMYYSPAAEGKYAIHLGDLSRYDDRWDGLRLLLSVMDLTYLAANGYFLEFRAKTDKPFPFDVVFYNYRDGVNWKNGYTVNQRQIPPNGEWHTVRIPLRNFSTWSGTDILINNSVETTTRQASWDKINILNFLAVQEDGSVHNLYLDSIKITK